MDDFHRKLLLIKVGIISVGFDVTYQLLVRSFAFVKYCRRNASTMREYISYL
jgi:hypothetical protein